MAYRAWLHVVVIHSVFWKQTIEEQGFCFFTFIALIPLYINSWTAEITHSTDLCLLFGKLHVVEDAKDNSEEVVPPVLLEGVTVTLHNLKHDCETSVGRNGKRQFYCIMAQPEQNCYCL